MKSKLTKFPFGNFYEDDSEQEQEKLIIQQDNPPKQGKKISDKNKDIEEISEVHSLNKESTESQPIPAHKRIGAGAIALVPALADVMSTGFISWGQLLNVVLSTGNPQFTVQALMHSNTALTLFGICVIPNAIATGIYTGYEDYEHRIKAIGEASSKKELQDIPENSSDLSNKKITIKQMILKHPLEGAVMLLGGVGEGIILYTNGSDILHHRWCHVHSLSLANAVPMISLGVVQGGYLAFFKYRWEFAKAANQSFFLQKPYVDNIGSHWKIDDIEWRYQDLRKCFWFLLRGTLRFAIKFGVNAAILANIFTWACLGFSESYQLIYWSIIDVASRSKPDKDQLHIAHHMWMPAILVGSLYGYCNYLTTGRRFKAYLADSVCTWSQSDLFKKNISCWQYIKNIEPKYAAKYSIGCALAWFLFGGFGFWCSYGALYEVYVLFASKGEPLHDQSLVNGVGPYLSPLPTAIITALSFLVAWESYATLGRPFLAYILARTRLFTHITDQLRREDGFLKKDVPIKNEGNKWWNVLTIPIKNYRLSNMTYDVACFTMIASSHWGVERLWTHFGPNHHDPAYFHGGDALSATVAGTVAGACFTAGPIIKNFWQKNQNGRAPATTFLLSSFKLFMSILLIVIFAFFTQWLFRNVVFKDIKNKVLEEHLTEASGTLASIGSFIGIRFGSSTFKKCYSHCGLFGNNNNVDKGVELENEETPLLPYKIEVEK